MSYWPQARFSNIYGPAEVNQCTHYDFGAADIAGEESVPIGEVWADSQGLIVDDEDREVADGQAGELIIRSPDYDARVLAPTRPRCESVLPA